MSFLAGLELSVVSMLIVFGLLYVISLILNTLKLVAGKEKPVEKKKPVPAAQPTPVVPKKAISFEELEKDSDMFVAAMVASMEAAESSKDKNFRIVSIKQL